MTAKAERLMIPEDLKMRREPRQQRTLEIIGKIEQATLQLLKEGGISLLNTNAIAERSGIDIKSLYRFFPNKEAIVYRLAQQWLEAIRNQEKAIYAGNLGLIETWNALDDMIDRIEQQYSGYGALWQAMDLIPALHDLEMEHEATQLASIRVSSGAFALIQAQTCPAKTYSSASSGGIIGATHATNCWPQAAS